MSNKLDPKPEKTNPLLGWKNLNTILQNSFSQGNKGNNFSMIQTNRYEMDKSEIVSELEKSGYKVSEPHPNILKVE